MTDWQDIESAPKDGTPIILALEAGVHHKLVYAGKWWEGAWHLFPDGVWSTATHWQPLPPPPTPQEGNKHE